MVYFATVARQSFRSVILTRPSARFQSTNVSSFLSRIDALRDAGIKKGGSLTHDLKIKSKGSSERTANRNTSMNKNAPGSPNRRAAGQRNGTQRSGTQRGGTQRQRSQGDGRDGRDTSLASTGKKATPKMNITVNIESGYRKADPRASKLDNFSEADLVVGSTGEKSDLHVSSYGGVLFKKRGPRTFNKNNNNNNNNKARGNKSRFAGARGSGNRRSETRVNARALAEKSEISPEEALVALKKSIRDSAVGRHISIDDVSVSTLAPYIPGTCATVQSRAWNAIQRASEEARSGGVEEKKAVISSIVESTVKGSLQGYALKASNEDVVRILNANPSLSLKAKSLILDLSMGKTEMSSLRK